MPTNIKNIIEIILSGEYRDSDQFEKASRDLTKLGKNLVATGVIMTTAGLAAAGAMGAMLKSSADLQAGIANALTLVDAQGDEYKAMSDAMTADALRLSRELGIAAKDITVSYYQVLSSGAEAMTEDFSRMSETALKLAKVTGLETAFAVEILSDTINSFSAELKDAERFADLFFATSKLTATTVPQLSEAMKTAGPIAAALGIELETTGALLAGWAAKGTKAGEAGMAFKQVMTRLVAPTAQAKRALEELNVQVFNLDNSLRDPIDILADLKEALADATDEEKSAALSAIAGQLAFARLAAILEMDVDKLREWKDELKETGQLQTGFDQKMKAFVERWNLLREEIRATAITIGNEYLPYAERGIDKLREWSIVAGDWVKEHKEVAKYIAIIAGALLGAGGLVTASGLALIAVTKLGAALALAFSPGGIALIGVVGLAAALIGISASIYKINRDTEKMIDEFERLDRMEMNKWKFPGVDATSTKYAVETSKKGMDEIASASADLASEVAHNMSLVPPAVSNIMESEAQRMKGALDFLMAETKARLENMRREATEAQRKVMERARQEERVPIGPEQIRYLELTGAINSLEILGLQREKVEKLSKTIADLKDELVGLRFSEEEHKEKLQELADVTEEYYSEQIKLLELEKEGLEVSTEYKEKLKGLAQSFIELGENADISMQKVADVPLIISEDIDQLVESVNEANRVIYSGFNAALSRMQVEGNKWRDSMKAMFRSFAQSAINEISRIIAEWVKLRLVAEGMGPFGWIGLGIGSLFMLTKMQYGGTPLPSYAGSTVMGGSLGRDSIPAAIGMGETVVSHDLTKRLDRFLKNVGEGFAGGPSLTIQTGVITATQQEALRFGRETIRTLDGYNQSVTADGEF